MSTAQRRNSDTRWEVVRPDPPDDEQVHVVPMSKSQPKHDLSANCWCDPLKIAVEPGSDPVYSHNLVQ